MKKADLQMIAMILAVLGVCLLVAGMFAFAFVQEYELCYPEYPYRDSSWGLMIFGIAMFVVGAGLVWRVKQNV